MLEEWVQQQYKDVKALWKKFSEDKRGYAIFYSPVKQNPDLLVIGFNPGGGSDSFDEDIVSAPNSHDYFSHKTDYPLARNMKIIFQEAGLLNALEESVKINLIFFRSQKADGIQNQEVIKSCTEKSIEIINHLKPKVIVTEGFKTFDVLLNHFNYKETEAAKFNDRRAIRIGFAEDKPRLYGLIHPSGAHGISKDLLQNMGGFLKELKGVW